MPDVLITAERSLSVADQSQFFVAEDDTLDRVNSTMSKFYPW